MDWQPIETAPRDGKPFTVRYEDGGEENGVYWASERYCIIGAPQGAFGPGLVSTEAGHLPISDPSLMPVSWRRAAHTPGPWRVDYLDHNGQRVVRGEHIEICTCWHHSVGSIEKEMEANAALIAEAPTLAASLRATVRQLDMVKVCINDPECRAVTERKIEEARAVLRAAGVDPDGGA